MTYQLIHGDPSKVEDWHVMPVEVPEHADTRDCLCGPYVDYTAPNGSQVWIHRQWHEVVMMDELSAALLVAVGEHEA